MSSFDDYIQETKVKIIDNAIAGPENYTDIKIENGKVILTPLPNTILSQVEVNANTLDAGRLASIELIIRERFRVQK